MKRPTFKQLLCDLVSAAEEVGRAGVHHELAASCLRHFHGFGPGREEAAKVAALMGDRYDRAVERMALAEDAVMQRRRSLRAAARLAAL